ncbi:MAG: hypothetical protein U5J98_09910 [Halobacteriales archaeon]|nr:hypothetical protein [Halobacteriales archaeon]
MAEEDDTADADAPTESPALEANDPAPEHLRSAVFGLADNPARSVAIVVAVVLALLYGVFIQQALLLVVWLLVAAFLVYLFWRLVRAHERLAAAADRLAADE